MPVKSGEALARKRLGEVLRVLRAEALERDFDLTFHEGLYHTEKALEWFEEAKYMKTPYLMP